ncbi:MAG: SDR family oxidoreductase [Oligoflexia bacterium]|nr:SDR family oxidoreductase [Oligoflexia bacterium]MBF0367809.1 SDR family oxidoreductase [Oligoflexia bacterium]
MRVMISGGAGFIGSHLVDLCLLQGCEVVVVDNLSTGRLENIDTYIWNRKITFVNVDLSDKLMVEKKLVRELEGRIDVIFHLAALADIVPSIERPYDYHRSNVEATINLLEVARHYRVSKFVYAASSSCYGLPEVTPTTETARIDPQYPYALTKYLGEEYVLHFGKVYKLPVISLRFFNVFGPRSRTSGQYGAVFGIFLKQKLEGKAFTVVGDGKQTRDFTFVTDVANVCLQAAKSQVVQEVFNIGSGGSYSINYLTSLLGGEVTYIPKRPGEPDCTFADISKVTRVLGWHPQVKFEEGVKEVLREIESWRKAPLWDEHSIQEATKSWFSCLS